MGKCPIPRMRAIGELEKASLAGWTQPQVPGLGGSTQAGLQLPCNSPAGRSFPDTTLTPAMAALRHHAACSEPGPSLHPAIVPARVTLKAQFK